MIKLYSHAFIRPSLGRGLGVGLCLAFALSLSAKPKPGKQLSDLLLSYMKVEDVHPDSLESNIADLKLRRQLSKNASERAVYAAAIARLYGARMYWSSMGTTMRDSTIAWYGKALSDKSLLAKTTTKRWKPFVVVGKDEGYFGGDMLNVVWRSMVSDVPKQFRDTVSVLPKYGDMIAFYRQQGLREGALLLALDSLDDQHEEASEKALIRLGDQYADVPLCAEVYLRLGTMTRELPRWRSTGQDEIEEANQVARRCREWLQEGLQKYPKYKRRAALQNALTQLSDPFMEWSGPNCVSPGKQYWWRFKVRNMQSVFINDKEVRVFPEHDPIETFCDSMQWTAPKPGRYKLTFLPHTNVKLTEKVKPLVHWVEVTTLQEVFQVMPDTSIQVLVVDPETGRPQPNVTVTAYKPTDNFKDTVSYFIGQTGQDGKVRVPKYDEGNNQRWRSQLTYKICSPDTVDRILATRYFYNINHWTGAPTTSQVRTELFTDRAIYRPGQTVHLSGFTYTQLDWNAEAAGQGKHTLRFYDANRKLVEERIVDADEMGVFSADFLLPTGLRNGSFSIEADRKNRIYFRVEEYKRPTFEVMLDDSLYVGGDSCEVRGSARNYDGSPLRGARVTGTYRWQTPWIYYGKRYPQNETLPLDTIETDDSGRFSYKLAIKNEKFKIETSRRSLSVNVDVLSQQGETHNAQHGYWRVEEPKPQPEPVKVDSTFLVRCVVDSFAINRPGRIEVTTNQSDVYLFYTLSAAGKIWKDDMVVLNNETFVLDLPYQEEYDQSLTASFCFVKEGRVHTDTKTIYLARPDNQLRVHWDTFRDLVQPGQQEEWRLTLRRPDGTPADANLMLTMYDASLDYFTKHNWGFDLGRSHRIYGVPFQAVSRISLGLLNFGGWYNQKTKKERNLDFTNIDSELFQVGVYTRTSGNPPILYKTNSANSMREYAAIENDGALQGRIAGLDIAGNANELEGGTAVRLQGTGNTMHEVVLAKGNEQEGEEESFIMPMRENFNETAFFYPQLRTDANGQVSIAFTLPESLTRWNLLGIAHTSDMVFANLSEQIEARKDLMAQLYLPRFVRPGDEVELTASVRNVSEQRQQGKGLLQILDAKTEKVLKSWKCDFSLDTKRDTALYYPLSMVNYPLSEGLIVRWAVQGTTCSDGEQRLLPVLPATMHVTNTVALTAYEPGVTNFDLSKIFPDAVSDRRLTVEYTTHPEQYALQTLPSLAIAKSQNVLSLAAAYYAGELGKALDVKMPDSTEIYLQKLKDLQDGDGGFRWYPQMETSPYLTREVSYLLTRLYMLTGKKYAEQVNAKAIHYLLSQRIDSTYLSTADLRTLYVALYGGVQLSKEEQKKVEFLLKLAKREDVEEDGYERQALLAVVLKQAGSDRKARKCAEQFRRYLVSSPERGTYIEFPKGSFTSIDRKLHIHVQLMEALQRMNPLDTLLRGMRRYLLQQKRTQEWSTPVNSANAIFALLSGKENSQSMMKDLLTLTRRGTTIQNFTAQDDTLGYLRDSLEIDGDKLPVKLRLQKFSKGESWGAVYADFEQPYEQVEDRTEGLGVRVEYPKSVNVGNRYRVRYYLTADRDYEYVTLVVPRPAALEPLRQISGYRWSRGLGYSSGLGYYQQVHDASVELNFCRIPRGEYLIEEEYYVERGGEYHTGVAVIRCAYAEEFQGHSEDKVILVKNEK